MPPIETDDEESETWLEEIDAEEMEVLPTTLLEVESVPNSP